MPRTNLSHRAATIVAAQFRLLRTLLKAINTISVLARNLSQFEDIASDWVEADVINVANVAFQVIVMLGEVSEDETGMGTLNALATIHKHLSDALLEDEAEKFLPLLEPVYEAARHLAKVTTI